MEQHLSHPALVRMFSGRALRPEVELAVPHLAQCRRCWELAARAVAELRREGRLARTADAPNAVVVLLEEEEGQALRRLRARAWWAELRWLPTHQQVDRIKADPAFLTLEMFATLAEEAASTSRDDPHVGEETALVAHALAAALPADRCPEPFRNDLQGEALAIVANCRRLAGDWRGSSAALGEARDHLQRGTGEPAREARLLSLRASLASDTGRLEQALELVARAAEVARQAQDLEAVASATIHEAGTLLAAYRHEEAIARGEEALRWLAQGEARLEILARNIVTESLVYLGRPAEALRSFEATRPLHQRFWSRGTELVSGYLEALLLDSLGHAREAEKAFRNNIESRMDAELYKDAFLTMLTYFESLFRRGALDKAARVCERLGQAGMVCHDQMTELWRDLLAAIDARRLTEHQLLVARHYLVRHWNAPARHAPLEGPAGSSGASLGPGTRITSLELCPNPKDQGEQLSGRSAATVTLGDQGGYEEALASYDRDLVAAGLSLCGGRVRETSRLLGISRNTLRAKIKKNDLAAGEPGPASAESSEPAVLSDEWYARALTRLRARAWWLELKSLPRGERLERLQTVSALQVREMVDVMLEEASAVALDDPRQGQETASVAHALAGLLPRSRCPEAVKHDLQAAALLLVANCRRLTGDWQGSAAALGAASRHLARGSGGAAPVARLLSIEASLALDRDQVQPALELLARAATLYRGAQDQAGVGSITVQEANTLLAAGRPEEALARAEDALRLLPPEEVRLEMLARSIVTESLVLLDRPAEALRSFIATRPLYGQLRTTRTKLRSGYLEALLLESLGHVQDSERAFQSHVVKLMEARLYKDAFLTLFTFFDLRLRRGDLDRAARACEEALDRIEEAGVAGHSQMRELWRALLTLVHARRLTESHLLEARHYLLCCGNAPAHGASPESGRATLPRWVTGAAAPEATTPVPPPAEPDPAPETSGPRLVCLEPPDPLTSLVEGGYQQALERYDRQILAAGLAQGKGRIAEASRLLGIPRNRLRAKLKRYLLTGAED